MAGEDEGVIRLEKFTADAKQLVAGAQQLADERQHGEVIPIHLLARAVERSPGFCAVLKAAGAAPDGVRELCDRALGKLARGAAVAYVSPRFVDLLDRAAREASRDRVEQVGTAQLLHALAQEIRGPVGEIFAHYGIGPGGFRDHIGALETAPKLGTAGSSAAFAGSAAAGGNAAGRNAADSLFLRDLVADARADRFDPVIGRDAELRRLLQILERRTKNHPLVIGEPGVGKTTVVRALARRIASGDVPTRLAAARLFELDTGALVAGAKLRGEIEQRLKVVTDRLAEDDAAESILVVEDLHTLFGTGITGSGVGELLKPLLSRGELRVIATTTTDGVQKIDERDSAILRRFASFVIEPPSVEFAQSILRGIATRYEQHHQVGISEGAIRTAVVLAKRYLGDRALPDSAVDLLDETASRKRVEVDGVPAEMDAAMRRLESLETQLAGLADDDTKLGREMRGTLEVEAAELRPRVTEMRGKRDARRSVVGVVVALKAELAAAEKARDDAREQKNFARVGELEHVTIPELKKRLEAAQAAALVAGVGTAEPALVTEADVAATVNEWTGIPVAKMLEGEAEKLLKMEARLAERVMGQAEAVMAVARAVRRGRVGLRDPGKPIGSFLFLGPSGVGKTHLAKALAEFLFDDENAMTRLDMSEFMEKHMAQRLIGSPPGYADSEQGGQLTEAIRRRPFSVLLFDEVEKAHGDVFNLMLQVLDDGRLTDGRGRTADFSNTVVIMTSNIGSGRILETEPKVLETPDGRDALRDIVMDEVSKFFRPEFINRIDEVVVFKALDKKDLSGIADIELKKLGRMLREREIQLKVSDAAKAQLVELGYEPALGARPLKRAIMREIQNPLAQAILADGALATGTIAVDFEGGKLTFTRV
ncbi:MAG: AAA family ATPase [Myxococcales bacterium]|nr:AAA family ATPase [Myxococcales bacterium]